MVLNWMRSMTRNASGTWSSESEVAMSAAAECFWDKNPTHFSLHLLITLQLVFTHFSIETCQFLKKKPRTPPKKKKNFSLKAYGKSVRISIFSIYKKILLKVGDIFIQQHININKYNKYISDTLHFTIHF